ncbi:hypothetical protein EVG20_g5169 [Dentipellis fragilis]|uniref:Mitochondrial import inner membrane translocase subunit Tim21 n=1 Tax=Dentipellis fragilis TaxID=205917 RepID=A0A4Y9YW04_9AGAM|nr:hypothetical protein EVG20_g5169 [Dentipellis fragilis]
MKANCLRQLVSEAHAASLAVRISRQSKCRSILNTSRTFATQRDPVPSSLLSQALDQKQRAARRDDSVGPFQLGLSQQSFGGDEKVKKWSELSTGGKVLRTTARTTNVTVILLGAGLTAVLTYALTSELFSKNSPTVLYNEACEKIKASPKVSKYLQGSLVFHNNPPSITRPRHRNRHVSSQIAVDSSGREHMLLNFYVQAKGHGTAEASDSYLNSAVEWTKEAAAGLSELTWDDTVSWTKDRALGAQESAKELFRYLTGDTVAPKSIVYDADGSSDARGEDSRRHEEPRGLWGSVTGLFGSIKSSSRNGSSEGSAAGTSGSLWQEGEIHADLVRGLPRPVEFLANVSTGSHSRNPTRVFVKRSSGVRENEPVMRWDSH